MSDEFEINLYPLVDEFNLTRLFYTECLLIKLYEKKIVDVPFLFPDEYAVFTEPICSN